MVIVGILATIAVPRFFDRGGFDSRGFYDQVIATLRYAQKEAIAQHHYICVVFTGSSVTLTLDPISPDPTAHAAAACPGSSNLASPDSTVTGPSYNVSNTHGVTLSGASNFYFDPLGKPSVAPQTITVSGYTATPITVEANTGYVH